MRKFYYINIKKQLVIWDANHENLVRLSSGDSTIEHNLKGLHDVSGARSLRIIKPLSILETLRPLGEMPLKGGELHDHDTVCDADVLTIGPRTEGEIYCLIGYGFNPKKIRGLDLISYSPYIDVGDMHQMPYDDNRFDVVISSCVLVYSKDPKKACDEILRVAKNDGLICIAQDTTQETGNGHIEVLGKPTKFCDEYLAFFDKHVKRVFFRHELPERLNSAMENQGSNYTMSLIFQVQK